ncbi:UNVERIFIED_ORG: hypothetical protein B2H98_12510 [Clostridium botulinum]|uniref:DUF1659 domain-containing protein n=1 Tax=Clostridium botulinum TaxID=1491 RepID=A0A6M0STM7_CLOBO|nr:DUF1659 domain-containing protein [Clostridium botulinum]MBN1059176.1 DUF1659 domain-containing protein [Clostridium botulinum]NFA43724.1 DUF1659 domain-containing protein [Clostridium botulinum]
MAVTKLQTGCTLGIEVQKGEDKLGDPIYSKKSFSNVNPAKTPDEVFEVASKIEEAIEANCGNYFITDTSKLMSE